MKVDFWMWKFENVVTTWPFLIISKPLIKDLWRKCTEHNISFFLPTARVPNISVRWIFMHRKTEIHIGLHVKSSLNMSDLNKNWPMWDCLIKFSNIQFRENPFTVHFKYSDIWRTLYAPTSWTMPRTQLSIHKKYYLLGCDII